MNRALLLLESYKPGEETVFISPEEVIQSAIKEIKRLLVVEEYRGILAMSMAEVKAISDGNSTNTISDTVEDCLYRINKVQK